METLYITGEEMDVLGANSYVFIVSERNHVFQFKTEKEYLSPCIELIEKLNQPCYKGKIELVQEGNELGFFMESSVPLEKEIIEVFGWPIDRIRYQSYTHKKFFPCVFSKLKPSDIKNNIILEEVYIVHLNCQPIYPVEIKFDGFKGWIVLPVFSMFVFCIYPFTSGYTWIRNKVINRFYLGG